jgi:acid phosphatase family membrane protein YuiD
MAVMPALPGGGFADLFTNRVFLAGFWAWFCAQTLKVGRHTCSSSSSNIQIQLAGFWWHHLADISTWGQSLALEPAILRVWQVDPLRN